MLISITTPCHENWGEMVPNEKGAFCNACAKTVVDFTGMSDKEVTQYFIQHQGQKTCGRFNKSQLTAPGINLPKLLSSAVPYWKKFLAIVIIAFGSLMTSCSDNNTTGDVKLLGDTTAALPALQTPVDSPHILLGDTTSIPLDTTTILHKGKRPACRK